MRTLIHPIPNPGAAATVDIYDSGTVEIGTSAFPVKPENTEAHMFRLALNADQIVNIRQLWAPPGGGTLRAVGADEPTVANTVETYERKLWPGRNVFRVITTTGPTVWELGAEITDEPV